MPWRPEIVIVYESEVSMDERIASRLRNALPRGDAEKAISFLTTHDFSGNGQIAIANIFVFAYEESKSVDSALVALETEWDKNWQYQHPDICADRDGPGGIGIRNKISLNLVYAALGIANPAMTT